MQRGFHLTAAPSLLVTVTGFYMLFFPFPLFQASEDEAEASADESCSCDF